MNVSAWCIRNPIPSLMFYRYFRGRVDEYLLTMELATERLVPHLMRFAVKSSQ